MTTDHPNPPSVAEMVRAFALVDRRLAVTEDPGPLQALRNRLAGELLADCARAVAPLSQDFELVTHGGGTTTVTDRAALVDSLRGLEAVADSIRIWIEVDLLLADATTVALSGRMRTLVTSSLGAMYGVDDLGPDDLCATSTPIAVFVRCAGETMTSEVVHLDQATASVTVLPRSVLPSLDLLRAAVDRPA